jgi:hypothetical protein
VAHGFQLKGRIGNGDGEAGAPRERHVRQVVAEIGDFVLGDSSLLQAFFIRGHLFGLTQVDELHSQLFGAPLDGGRLAAGDESCLDAHGVREAETLAVMSVEDLHLGDAAFVGQRDEADAAVGKGAIDIHEKKPDLSGAIEYGGRGILWHGPILSLFVEMLEIIGDFDQVAVGIAKINGPEVAHSSVTLDRTGFDVNSQLSDVADDFVERSGGDEAEIGGAGCGVGGVWPDLVAALVELDGLRAKGEGLAAVQGYGVHAQDFGVEVDSGVNIGYGENEVVELIQGKGHVEGIILAGILRPNSEAALPIIQIKGALIIVGDSAATCARRPDLNRHVERAEAVVVHVAYTETHAIVAGLEREFLLKADSLLEGARISCRIEIETDDT